MIVVQFEIFQSELVIPSEAGDLFGDLPPFTKLARL